MQSGKTPVAHKASEQRKSCRWYPLTGLAEERLSGSDRVRADRARGQKDAPNGGGASPANTGRPLPPQPSARAADPGPRRDDLVVDALKSQESDLSSLLSALGSKESQGVQKTTPHGATEPESVDECTESGLLLALAKASPLVSPRNSQGSPAAAAAPFGHVGSAPSSRGEAWHPNANAGAIPTGSEKARAGIGATDAMDLDEQAIERAIADAERVHAKQESDMEAIRR